MVAPAAPRRLRPHLAAALAAGALLGACAQQPAYYDPAAAGSGGYRPGLASPGVGTLGGAAAGAAAGRAIAGENDNLAAILGGAAVGAIAGNVLADNAIRDQRASREQAEADAAARQQLEYERQRQLQQAETDRQIRERAEFEEWQRTRGAATAPAAQPVYGVVPVGGPANAYPDVIQAQRYLTALGYYAGSIDGIIGPQTRGAVTRFQSDRGLSPTGQVTPDVLQAMQRSIG